MKGSTKMTAVFVSGHEIATTSEKHKNRLAFYNWICENRLGKKYGKLVEIREQPWFKAD